MKFTINKKHLFTSLKQVTNFLVKRLDLPILNNILIQVINNVLLLTSTDLETEIIAQIKLNSYNESGSTTVAARKFFDIFRYLPEDAEVTVVTNNNNVIITSGYSKFLIVTLPACDFPNTSSWKSEIEFTLPQIILKKLIESTRFSMASQDIRFYLNGMLLKIQGNKLCAVATDGHRLAICSTLLNFNLSPFSHIIPRKVVLELMRILNTNDIVKLKINNNNICFNINNYIYTSRLLGGCFPNYEHLLLQPPEKILEVNRNILKQAFMRVSVLSNEYFNSIKLNLNTNQLKITSYNQEQEKAEEIILVKYQDSELEIGFNINYILDVLSYLKCINVRLRFTNSISNMWIQNCDNDESIYCIMPIKL